MPFLYSAILLQLRRASREHCEQVRRSQPATEIIAKISDCHSATQTSRLRLSRIIELGKFDTLTAEAQRAIDLLQERRTALISAAVTGQIDVRGLATASAVSPEANCV